MKTTSEILEMIVKFLTPIYDNMYCSCINCWYCGIDEIKCPKYIYSICADTIESW